MSEITSNTGRQSHAKISAVISEVEKVVVGKRHELELLLSAMLSGGHILIEDVPGVGKTTLASALARSAGLDFKRAQFTPDVMASDITGFNMYNRSAERFEFREGLVMTNILLADEIRASPKTQSSLLEAMEENSVTVDGITYRLPDPFFVIATQNPTGYVGTYPLPEAQLDRFSIRMSMGYPNEEEELAILAGRRTQNPLNTISAACSADDVAQMIKDCAAVKIDPEITKYIVSLVRATRSSDKISLGASPRAGQALVSAGKVRALMKGRAYVTYEDLNVLAYPVFRHRMKMNFEAVASRVSPDEVFLSSRTGSPFQRKHA